jgi:hypothetical protein
MRPLKSLSIRAKAFAASLVLLLCLIGIGGNAYLTSDRTARNLDKLTKVNLPKQQIVATLETDITAIHLKVFRYVSWASNSVSASLLRTLSAETRHDLNEMKERIAALKARRDLTPVGRELVDSLALYWQKYAAAANDTLDVGATDAPMATMMLGGTDDDFQKVGTCLATLSAFVDGQTASIGFTLAGTAKENQHILAFGGAAGVLLSILVTLLISRSIVRPIQYVTGGCSRCPRISSTSTRPTWTAATRSGRWCARSRPTATTCRRRTCGSTPPSTTCRTGLRCSTASSASSSRTAATPICTA